MMEHNRLYWWSECHIQKKELENYGDLVGPYLFKKITGTTPSFYRTRDLKWWQGPKAYYASIGSIIDHLDKHATVWGSGIIALENKIPGATYLAVRGPLSRKRILKEGIACPEVYGDPALLLPRYYQPEVSPQYDLGIIPHINDLEQVKQKFKDRPEIGIIDLNTKDVEATTKDILNCKAILSSSLHGLIVPHAYGIPAVQVRFSDRIHGDGIKYQDYYQSVGLEGYTALELEEAEVSADLVHAHDQSLPDAATITNLCDGLMKACPFNTNSYE